MKGAQRLLWGRRAFGGWIKARITAIKNRGMREQFLAGMWGFRNKNIFGAVVSAPMNTAARFNQGKGHR